MQSNKTMKDLFLDLLQYDHNTNRKLIDLLSENKEKVTEKSWQLLSHILNVHQIWILKIQQNDAKVNPWAMLPIEDLHKCNEANFAASQNSIQNLDLNSTIQWTTQSGNTFSNSVADIIFQIINHSNYHRAQIATELKSAGIPPLQSDYILHKMKSV